MTKPNTEAAVEELLPLYVDHVLASIQQPVCCYQIRESIQNDQGFALLMHRVQQEMLDAITSDVMIALPPHLVACNIDAH